MLTGYIIDDKPVLPVIVGWNLNMQEFLALVDTGFTGELKVSPEAAEELGLVVTDVRTVSQADGKPTVWGSGLAYVSLEGTKRQVSVLIGPGQPIIGVRLLKNFGYILTMNFSAENFYLKRIEESLNFDV